MKKTKHIIKGTKRSKHVIKSLENCVFDRKSIKIGIKRHKKLKFADFSAIPTQKTYYITKL